MPMKIENLDFCFENLLVRVTANRNYPEIKLAGLSVGPFAEGNEYEIYYWVAEKLAKAGIVHFHEEDMLDINKIYSIHYKEGIQSYNQLTKLPENFYPKLRVFLKSKKDEVTNQPERMQSAREYERVMNMSWEIINYRLTKIVTLSLGPTQTDQVKKLTTEEELIYDRLSRIINLWKTEILKCESEG